MTPTEELNRLKRALPIADIMQAMGITSKMASHADPGTPERNGKDSKEWRIAAMSAGFEDDYTPGRETQRLVVQLLVNREAAAAKLKRKDVMRQVNAPKEASA